MTPTTPAKDQSKTIPSKDPNAIRLDIREGEDPAKKEAEAVIGPYLTNAIAYCTGVKGTIGTIDITNVMCAMADSAKKVKANDMSDVEAMLLNQAIVLNGMFADLSKRAASNRSEGYFEASQIYLKLAFKAQNQARMTLETLSTIKNPPIVYAKQANIANGPQQVNNATAAPPRANENQNPPNKLLEALHEQPLDTGAPGTAGGGDKPMETVGEIDGATNA